MDRANRFAEIRDNYILALTRGEPALARSVISEALEGGMRPTDIYLQTLAPSQIRIGQMWHDGLINVAQEHLATMITLRMMDFLRERMTPRPNLGVRAVVSALEGDLHYTGARIVADFLVMDGWDVDFLGGGLPAADLAKFVGDRRANLLAISSTMPEFLPNARTISRMIRRLPSVRTRILLGGQAPGASGLTAADFGCDAIARSVPEAILEARRLVGLSDGKITLDEQLASMGRRIREARASRKMTQQALANASGLERTYISMVENGRQNLTIEAVLKIANALDTPLSDLLSQP